MLTRFSGERTAACPTLARSRDYAVPASVSALAENLAAFRSATAIHIRSILSHPALVYLRKSLAAACHSIRDGAEYYKN